MHYLHWVRYGSPLYCPHSERQRVTRLLREAVDHTGGSCLIWFGNLDSLGYPFMVRYEPLAYLCEKVHGPQPSPDHEPVHVCNRDTPRCFNPQHLRWGIRDGAPEDRPYNDHEIKFTLALRADALDAEIAMRHWRVMNGRATHESPLLRKRWYKGADDGHQWRKAEANALRGAAA